MPRSRNARRSSLVLATESGSAKTDSMTEPIWEVIIPPTAKMADQIREQPLAT